MIRQIANKIKGRRKLTDENLNLEEALALLNGLNENTRGNVHYHGGAVSFDLDEATPRDMVDFVVRKFQVLRKSYSDIRHQVYSGERSEKHYLDLAHGDIKSGYAETIMTGRIRKGSPYIKASIDFVVEKQE